MTLLVIQPDFRNDSQQYLSMAELAKSNQIKVILCSVLPA
jgi:hypothetical protein